MTVHQNDFGIQLTCDMQVDITFGVTYTIHVKKPSGKRVIWAGQLSGTDSIVYTTLAGDLNEAGVYEVQGHVVGATFSGHGAVDEWTVLPISA